MTHLALPTPRGMVLGDVIPGDRVRDVALVLAGAALTAWSEKPHAFTKILVEI